MLELMKNGNPTSSVKTIDDYIKHVKVIKAHGNTLFGITTCYSVKWQPIATELANM